ncbi:MAG: hypothetical protein LC749_04000, partial [Actinobacteria bacterium]|nr:hypothetical protein [Actinomycetota bacterium]
MRTTYGRNRINFSMFLRVLLPVLIVASFVAPAAQAAIGTATKIKFTTNPFTMVAGSTSGTITVQTQTSPGAPVNMTSNVSLGLATDSSGGSFRDSTNTSTITSVTVLSGQSSASFLYRDTVAGGPTITVTNPNLTTARQTETVTVGPLDHITVSPSSSTITSGGSQTYTAAGFDIYGNSSDVTSATTFSIGPNGSCSGATCTATAAGAHTVTATSGGKTATATLMVNAGTLDHITISPSTATIAAGSTQAYTAQGFDVNNNSLGNVTGSTTFTASGSASCSG